jgi:TRAP-type C4-dicarboxylate transport system substrate-binding protein
LRKPADFSGLKIRTMDVPAHMEMVKALGASPTPVSWTELYGALQTGVIDGQENPIGNILYAKVYEVQKYLTLDGHVTLLNTWVVNEEWFKKLPAKIKSAVLEAAEVAALTNRGMSQLNDAVGVGELKKKMQVTVLSDKELETLQKVTQEKVVPFIQNAVEDKVWIEKVKQEISKAEKHYSQQ